MTLVPGPLSVPASCAFTQLRSVWCEIPSSRATSRMFCPSFTRCTASVLNSVVYSCLGSFNIASFFLVEFTHDLNGDEISGEHHAALQCGSILVEITCPYTAPAMRDSRLI